jgi:hypothetical protein
VVEGHTRTTQVTYTRDIEPLLAQRCVGCHRADGYAPLDLSTYQRARQWAPQIRDEVLGRRMPPWPASEGVGDYANSRSLSPIEMDLIAAWTAGAMPKGDDRPHPPAADSPAENQLRLLRPLRDGAIDGGSASVSLTYPAAKWITGWRLTPLGADRTQRAEIRAGTRLLGVWVPSDAWVSLPRGIALPVSAHETITVAFESGKTRSPMAGEWRLELRFGAPGSAPRYADLPCGRYTARAPIRILEFMPRADAADARIAAVSETPDGRVQPLFGVPSFNPSVQPSLRLREPLALPRGSTFMLRSSASCTVGVLFTSTAPDPVVARAR